MNKKYTILLGGRVYGRYFISLEALYKYIKRFEYAKDAQVVELVPVETKKT